MSRLYISHLPPLPLSPLVTPETSPTRFSFSSSPSANSQHNNNNTLNTNNNKQRQPQFSFPVIRPPTPPEVPKISFRPGQRHSVPVVELAKTNVNGHTFIPPQHTQTLLQSHLQGPVGLKSQDNYNIVRRRLEIPGSIQTQLATSRRVNENNNKRPRRPSYHHRNYDYYYLQNNNDNDNDRKHSIDMLPPHQTLVLSHHGHHAAAPLPHHLPQHYSSHHPHQHISPAAKPKTLSPQEKHAGLLQERQRLLRKNASPNSTPGSSRAPSGTRTPRTISPDVHEGHGRKEEVDRKLFEGGDEEGEEEMDKAARVLRGILRQNREIRKRVEELKGNKGKGNNSGCGTPEGSPMYAVSGEEAERERERDAWNSGRDVNRVPRAVGDWDEVTMRLKTRMEGSRRG